ncbi:MAG: hypothetical protein B7Z40_19180 [Bosea sp. 12-68-7]|nr:MAG: hypothetical protein B7Z40_19180 [Bosea sp. 12-68-7]
MRLLASGLFIFRVALWLAAATYAPALALEKVTGIPLWITIIATGTLTTLYTALGGMRAVIWTDVMQLIVLFGGQLIIVFVAAGKIPGGLGGVWDTALADGRMDLSLSFSMSERVNLGAVLVAGAFLHLVQMATDQVSVQRYLTAGSLQEAKRSLWIKLWLILPVLVLFYGTGLVLYAFYSTAPAGSQAQQVGNARWITVVYGLIVVGLAFGVSFMPGNLVESVNTVIGLIGGPLLGLFFLGMFTQRATTRGALLGCLAGFVSLLGIFMYQNGVFTAAKPETLVSFIWFSLVGTIITMAVGLLTSGRSATSSGRHQ